MASSMRYRLTDDRARRMDQLRGQFDQLPDKQWKADLVDIALINLVDTIRNHEEYEGPPRYAKEFNTRVVESKTHHHVKLKDP